MKHKLIAVLGLFTMLTFGSCGEDFLYKAPQGSINQEALTNAVGVNLLVIDAYAALTENQWGGSIFNWTFGGMYGGDANKGSDPGDQSVLNEMEIYQTLSSNSYLEEKYNFTYKGVKRVNLGLQVMAEAEDMSDAEKSLREGELKFLRALFYFEAVKVFGPYIPWVDESNTENDPKIHNDQDIYPNIIADIDVAISNLPNQPSEVGRTYVWAAKALKAKILMQKGDLAAAKPVLADVISNGSNNIGLKYQLANDLDMNWSTYNDNTSPESVYEIQFSSDVNDNGNPGMALCYPHNSGPGGCCGFYQPSYELVNSYQVDANGLPYLNAEYRSKKSVSTQIEAEDTWAENDNTIPVDPRLDFAVGRYGIPYKDWGYPRKDWVRNPTNGGIFMPRKHVYSKAESDAGYGRSSMYGGWAPGSAMNIQYLSLRDLMLLYAECLANDGDLSGAMTMVNAIRTRAALPENIVTNADGTPAANYKIATYPASHAAFSDKATCVKAVRMERKLELAMEGHRWFDLQRWGGDYMASELSDYLDYEQAYIPKFVRAARLPATKTMFPLPHTQVQTMGEDENDQPYLVQPGAWTAQ